MPKKKKNTETIEDPAAELEDGEENNAPEPQPTLTRPSMVGRPSSFKSPAEMRKRMEAYFAALWNDKRGEWIKLPNKAGLAFTLGVSKDTLSEYRTNKLKLGHKEYSDAIKDAYHIIEQAWAERLEGSYPTGAIFYLKNAFKDDYRDRYDHTTDGKELPAPIIVTYAAESRLKRVMEKRAKPV